VAPVYVPMSLKERGIMEFDDAQLKAELDEIMTRIDAIIKKVESLDAPMDPADPPDGKQELAGVARDRQVR
jgi:hypothetical protein